MKKILLTLVFPIIFSGISFAQDDCELPEITEVTGAGTYCPDEEVTITITGDLNDATDWQWYTEDCGEGVIENENGTSITVTVTETKTYYVKGVGGCTDEEEVACTEIEVVLDNEPPTVECPENIEVEAEDGLCEAVVTYELPTGTDNCSEEVSVEKVEGLGSGESFPVGVTTEKYSFTDDLGNETICSFTVTVLDTQLPSITCVNDIEVDNDPGECGAVVTYDLPTFSDNCPDANMEMTEGLGSGSLFPVGTTVETYTVTDASGNTSSCSITVIVNDVEPPVITVSDEKTSQWPPNHKPFMIEIDDYIISVTDNCPGVSEEDIIIDEASSDEPDNGKGDGNTTDDIVVSDDCRTIHLLAERQGGGNGRVYTIYLAVADAHGNIGTAEIKAEVPHDRGKKSQVIDDGPVYVVNGCDIEVEEETNEAVVEGDGNNSSNFKNVSFLETYPNPFNRSFEIWFTPESDDRVVVDLYSFTGAKIKEIYIGEVKANRDYSWIYDSGNLRDELYLILIKGKISYAFKRIVHK